MISRVFPSASISEKSSFNIMKIIVTGASGQVGSELRALSKEHEEHQFTFLSRNDLDITDAAAVQQQFDKLRPDACINCAAYTAVDKAETEIASSYAINVTGTTHLATACAAHQSIFLHYSSDYVYHSVHDRPIQESDATTPQGIYAKHKLEGEIEALNVCSRSIILRTSWVYSYFGHNFVKTMLKLGQDRAELSIVADQVGAPTYAHDIAAVSLSILHKLGDHKAPASVFGIYNFSNAGQTNWADFAATIFQISDVNCTINHTTTAAYGAPAARPLWSVLSHTKLKSVFDIEPRHWEISLKECLNKLQFSKYPPIS